MVLKKTLLQGCNIEVSALGVLPIIQPVNAIEALSRWKRGTEQYLVLLSSRKI